MILKKPTIAICCYPGCVKKISRHSRFFCNRDHFDMSRMLLTSAKIAYNSELSRAQMQRMLKDAAEKVEVEREKRTDEVSIEDELKRQIAQYKDRAEWATRVAKKAEKQILAQSELIHVITTTIGALDVPKPRRIEVPRKEVHSPQTAVVEMSDLHMGESDEEKETHAPGYDWQVFVNELRILEKKIIKIVSHHRHIYSMDKLVLLWLGDFVCGHEVFPGQAWRTEDHAVMQVLNGAMRIADFVNALSTFFTEIEIECVPGNHGALRGKEPGPTSLNWDFLIYHVIRMLLRNNTRVKFSITPSWWTIKKIGNCNFYLDHGATFGRRWMGIPHYGILRAEARTRKMLYTMKQLRESGLRTFDKRNPVLREMLEECAPHILTEDLRFDYIALGHHHVPHFGEGIILNGAFSRGNYYAMKSFQSISVPTQWLYSVHPKVGASWFYPLRLDMES
jgi:hypothetical protein